jgi:tetratricopeptide (TPR) repeat protein
MTRTTAVSLLFFVSFAASSFGLAAPPLTPTDQQKSATPNAPNAAGSAAPAANTQAIGPYLDGLDALAAGQYAEAEKAFAKAIAADEENAACYQARGVARTLAQDFPGALTDFQRAQRLGDAGGWETRAWIGVANKMNDHPEAGFAPGLAPRAEADYALALSDMSQAYWDSRTNHRYYDQAARRMVESPQPFTGGFTRVAALYVEHHRAVSGDAAKVALARVQAKIGAGEYLSAMQTIQPLLEANPGDVDVLSARAQLLLELGDVADARAEYTNVLTRRQSAAAYVGRARAAARMGDAGRVTRDLAEAARLDAGAAAAARRDIDAALAANRAPANPQALWNQLETQVRSGSPAATWRATATAILRATGAVRIRYDERYQDRLAALESALRAKPDDPDLQVALARYLREESEVLTEQVGPRAEPTPYRVQSSADLKHDVDRAEQILETVLKAHPGHLGALALKVHMLILAAQYDEAEAVVRQALAIKGDDPDLLEEMAGLLRIQAARRISAAGNLRQIKSWSITDFDQDPPVEYTYWRLPTQQELQQAAGLEMRAQQLSHLAEELLAKAAASAGATPLGYYYQATLQRARGDDAAAKISMTQAVSMKPDFEKAWYELSAICTHLRDSEGAMTARAMAYNLAQTTVAAELKALWYKIPHTQFKSGRDAVAEGLKRDPADARLPAYLAVIDEATEKPDEALVHYRMAEALSDAALEWHGTRFVPPAQNALPPSAEEVGFASAVRLRIGALLLDQGKAAQASEEFAAVFAMLGAMPESASKAVLASAMLPPAEVTEGIVPLAESVGSLRIRVSAGAAYARWAVAATNSQDVALAGKTYRRLLVSYVIKTDSLDALKAIADLGMAELYLQRGQFTEAQAAMKDTPAVPQDFWQEMRRTESAIAARGR